MGHLSWTGRPRCALKSPTASPLARICLLTCRKFSSSSSRSRIPQKRRAAAVWQSSCSYYLSARSSKEERMTNIHVDKVGEMAVVECDGRFVRSDEAFKLRDAVTSQRGARIVVLDLTEMLGDRGRRYWGAGIPAALVPGPRYPVQVVQSFAVGEAQVGKHECYVGIRYCLAGRDDGPARPGRPAICAGFVSFHRRKNL